MLDPALVKKIRQRKTEQAKQPPVQAKQPEELANEESTDRLEAPAGNSLSLHKSGLEAAIESDDEEYFGDGVLRNPRCWIVGSSQSLHAMLTSFIVSTADGSDTYSRARRRLQTILNQQRKVTILPVDEIGSMPIKLPFKPDKRWMNMDKVEVEKLEWMQDMAPSDLAAGVLRMRGGRKGYCALKANGIPPSYVHDADKRQARDRVARAWTDVRFDFNGALVPPSADVATDLGLHHHGQDVCATSALVCTGCAGAVLRPLCSSQCGGVGVHIHGGHPQEHQAGYTLAELVHLSRSAVPAQRALALEVLGRILDQVNAGT